MAERKGAFHLRLIFDREKAEEPTDMCFGLPEQIPLPYSDQGAFIFAFVAAMSWSDFVGLVTEGKALWVIDVRVAPRFDILGYSRAAAFKLFQEQNVTYIDLFGQLGVKSYRSVESNPTIWGDELCRLLAESGRGGPYILLFDNHDLMVNANNILPRMIGGALGEEMHFRRVSTPPNRQAARSPKLTRIQPEQDSNAGKTFSFQDQESSK